MFGFPAAVAPLTDVENMRLRQLQTLMGPWTPDQEAEVNDLMRQRDAYAAQEAQRVRQANMNARRAALVATGVPVSRRRRGSEPHAIGYPEATAFVNENASLVEATPASCTGTCLTRLKARLRAIRNGATARLRALTGTKRNGGARRQKYTRRR
jgi:hypothetical protein